MSTTCICVLSCCNINLDVVVSPGTEEARKSETSSVVPTPHRSVSPVLVDSTSDNSQSSNCTPPDITQSAYLGGTGSQTDTSDPPDLNPEDIPQNLTSQADAFVTNTETIELNDSNEPPDITGVVDDYSYDQESSEGDDIPIDNSEFQEGLVQGADHSLISHDLLTSEFNSPDQQSSYFTDASRDDDLGQVSQINYLSHYQDTGFGESLQAVAPGDILAVSLPEVQAPVLDTQQLSPNKRGPGRPRKDGFEPIPRKKTM